jgi:hypothetical protein
VVASVLREGAVCEVGEDSRCAEGIEGGTGQKSPGFLDCRCGIAEN